METDSAVHDRRHTLFGFDTVVFSLVVFAYAVLLFGKLKYYWMSPFWANNDSFQQVFTFNRILNPGIYKDDLIYTYMRSYLPPLHYGVMAVLTWLTRSPILASHVVMALQIILTIVPLFLVVYRWAGLNGALLSLLWFLHSERLISQMASGLPRGWVGVAVAMPLLAIAYKKPVWIYLSLFFSSLISPIGALVSCLTYSLWLVFHYVSQRSAESRRLMIAWAVVAPLIALVQLPMVHKPPEIGPMVTLSQAKQMPEFSRPGGRFGLLPFPTLRESMEEQGLRFLFRALSYSHSSLSLALFMVSLAAAATIAAALKSEHHREAGRCLGALVASTFIAYFLSKQLAFYLFIPNRYLLFPLNLFFIITFSSVIAWTAERLPCVFRMTPYVAMVMLLFFLSGSGFDHKEGFDKNLTQNGGLWHFVSSSTPPDAVIAGYPTRLDPLPLVGMRSAYVTTKVAHPFFLSYYNEIKRRIILSVRAYYAPDLQSFISLLDNERINYFIFAHEDFKPGAAPPKLFLPLYEVAQTAAKDAANRSAFKEIRALPKATRDQFIVYSNANFDVIDVAKLLSVRNMLGAGNLCDISHDGACDTGKRL